MPDTISGTDQDDVIFAGATTVVPPFYFDLLSTNAAGFEGIPAASYDRTTAWVEGISDDFTKVLFETTAKGLDAGDTNEVTNVSVKDVVTGALTLVSSNAAGQSGNDASFSSVLSPDGTKVIFSSASSNLVSPDPDLDTGYVVNREPYYQPTYELFIRDLTTGSLSRLLSAPTSFAQEWAPVFSPDGSRVAFVSSRDDLVAGDTNGRRDVFVMTLATGAIERINTTADGAQSEGGTVTYAGKTVAFSEDGTKIAFTSDANGLVPEDSNGLNDVFVKDLTTGAITRVSTGSNGAAAQASLFYQPWQGGELEISPDGTKVLFVSEYSGYLLDDGGYSGSSGWYIKDLITGALTRVSERADGTSLGRDMTTNVIFSDDGGAVLFASQSDTIIPNDPTPSGGIFRKDLATGEITRLFDEPMISGLPDGAFAADGRFIFQSRSDGLVAGSSGPDNTKILLADPDFPYEGPVFAGGAGFDTLDLSGRSGAVTVDFNTGTVSEDGGVSSDITDIEGVIGPDAGLTVLGDDHDIEATGGTGADDMTAGGTGASTLSGGDGNDSLTGTKGDLTLNGGDGEDTITAGTSERANSAAIDGGNGNDTIYANARSNTINGGGGNDFISTFLILFGRTLGNTFEGIINGGPGEDIIQLGQTLVDEVIGGLGDDVTLDVVRLALTLSGNGQFTVLVDGFEAYRLPKEGTLNFIGSRLSEHVTGGLKTDFLDGAGGNDTLLGGGGDDFFSNFSSLVATAPDPAAAPGDASGLFAPSAISYELVTDGDDVYDGGDGDDLLDFGGANGARVDLAITEAQNTGCGMDVILNVEVIAGSEHDDQFFGNAADNHIEGKSGNDLVTGRSGNDRLFGGTGDDTLHSDDGDDTVIGDGGFDRIFGGGGADRLEGGDDGDRFEGGFGADTLDGGWGNDTLLGDEGFHEIHGDYCFDLIRGGDGHDLVYGGGNDDTVFGGAGRDTLFGDQGDESLSGGTWSDEIAGGYGSDTIHGDGGDDTLFGEDGADSILGGAGHDLIEGGLQSDTIFGGDGHDTVDAGWGRDYVDLGNGNDLYVGEPQTGLAARDTIVAGNGNDTVEGGDGDDSIDGGNGNDSLLGGDGADTINGVPGKTSSGA